jgi:formylglycine-generating enzyme required for sulfatase activity
MSDYEQAVFISYAWGGEREDVVNQIDQALQTRGIRIIRDKRDLGYKGSISKFMDRIGQGDCVILVISDKYLRSPNCMYELVEIAENRGFQDRVFPIVLQDADIYNPVRRIQYIKHWEEKRAELAEAIKTLDPANLHGIREEIDLYDRIRDKVSGLTSILKDMNTLTPEMHSESDFDELYNAIEKRIKELPAQPADSRPAPTREAPRPTESARPSGGTAAAAPAVQNFNVGGGAFSGPVQFGNTTQNIGSVQQIGSVQNVYYAAPVPDETKSPYLNETIEAEFFEPETILIPEGAFWMGSDPGGAVPAYETPRHEIFLPAYRIGKYPVTNAQYEEFIRQTGRSVASVIGWGGRKVPDGLENQPVMGVTLEDARSYCKWLSEVTKRSYELPNEAQLEKAYQGSYGCSDIVENIYLWTGTLWGEKGSAPDSRYRYPWKKDDGRNNPNANSQVRRVVCRYQKVDGADPSKRHSRAGQFPGEAGLSGARHSFRVVMIV